jgi:hypothetical protein
LPLFIALLVLLGHASASLAGDEVVVEDPGRVAEGYPVAVTAEVGSGTAARVHSGTITAGTEVRARPAAGGAARTGVVSLDYTGSHASHCCWLQFIWREVLVTTAGGTAARAGRVSSTGGSYDLTTDPAKPNYNTDSASRTDPCYQSAGMSNDSHGGLTIFDIPGASQPAAAAAREAGATRVESIAHFDAFFVCGGVVLVHVAWTATYTWTRTTGWQGPDCSVSPPDTSGDRPNERQRQRLNAQYPGQTIVQ